MSKNTVNINKFFEENASLKSEIIRGFKESCFQNIEGYTKVTLNNLIDWCVEFKQIPDQKPSNLVMILSIEEQIPLLLEKWLKNYLKSIENPITERQAKSSKTKNIVVDPALALMLSSHHKAIYNSAMSQKEIHQSLEAHQNLMAIENIQGHLLEAYISGIICKPPFSFIWCNGQAIKAADFCKRVEKNGKAELLLLQIKNKYNTENSSSNKIRIDTPIRAWYRLGIKNSSTQKNIPDYKWENLNYIVEEISGTNPQLSEQSYLNFLEQTISQNPHIL